jgi:hypothetical protein
MSLFRSHADSRPWLRAFVRAASLVGICSLSACAEHGAAGQQQDAASTEPGSDLQDGSAPPPRPSADAHLDSGTGGMLGDAGATTDDGGLLSPDSRLREGGVVGEDAAQPDAEPGLGGRESLVLPERWLTLGPDEDPFADRPATFYCVSAAVMAETLMEERVLSVDTGHCEYLTAKQVTQREVRAGENIKVRLWHFALSAAEPAEAHAVVRVDSLAVLDERVAIPQPGGLISRVTTVERTIPAGAPVYFHLHNHGANSWSLVEVSAGP